MLAHNYPHAVDKIQFVKPGPHVVVIVLTIGNRKQVQVNSERNMSQLLQLIRSLCLTLLMITDNYNIYRLYNHAYSMTNNMLLVGFLFRQIVIVVCLNQRISSHLFATVFMVGEKAIPYQTSN